MTGQRRSSPPRLAPGGSEGKRKEPRKSAFPLQTAEGSPALCPTPSSAHLDRFLSLLGIWAPCL